MNYPSIDLIKLDILWRIHLKDFLQTWCKKCNKQAGAELSQAEPKLGLWILLR